MPAPTRWYSSPTETSTRLPIISTCAYELEAKLRADGKQELLDTVQGTLPRGMRAVFVTQPQALGLGHAVLCAGRSSATSHLA